MLKRLPSFSEIVSVYSVVAVMVYGWNLIHYLWKVPSWLLFLTVGEVFALLAYALSGALLESLVIIGVLLLASFLLPEKIFKNEFTVRATWLVIVAYGTMMVLLWLYGAHADVVGKYWDFWSAVSLILALLTASISVRLRFLRSTALWLADQLSVFLIILMPASLVSILVVLFRNLI